jgi:uncharacterized protein (DUF608 family)
MDRSLHGLDKTDEMGKIICFLCCLLFEQLHAQHVFNGSYGKENNQHIAFPIGGMGAGMFCVEGTGAISHMSTANRPDLNNEPLLFAAISVKEMPGSARVLEGPVPDWKKFGQPNAGATGDGGTDYGLPRFSGCSFLARFPFATIKLTDASIPLAVTVTAWSPFIPTDADNSSLPVGALEYRFKNTGTKTLHAVFSYHAKNFLAGKKRSIKSTAGGFILAEDENVERQSYFAVTTDEPNTVVDYCWFRGGWWDPLSMAWKKIEENDITPVEPVEKDAPGASLFIPFTLRPGEEKAIKILMAWYTPNSNLRTGVPVNKSSDSAWRDASVDRPSRFYKPWYSSKFKSIEEMVAYWKENYEKLRHDTKLFTDAFYKSSLPAEVTEAIAANLTILKSTTVLRQYDGRFWGWEGSNDASGSCAGSCTHVWNYAQALPNLFPSLERSIRETEYHESMDSFGHQNYRAALPIRSAGHNYYLPAADGQLGSIMRVYRDWRISGDGEWLRRLFPKIRLSMDYAIETWDPRHTGTLEEPHHNTYDIQFWGPDPMCTSIYLGALEAFIEMSAYLDTEATRNLDFYRGLLAKGKKVMESELFNGQFFFQKIKWTGLRTTDPISYANNAGYTDDYAFPEAKALLAKEGPKYQYGNGCLSDGMIGAWEAEVCGLPALLDKAKVLSHLAAVYNYNFKKDLSGFSNPQRPGFAMGHEGGLLLCTWPRGGEPSLPFVYSNEVWTGVEYEVASHLILMGKVKEGLEMVRTTRSRYDGRVRNPFDEYEAGNWYARAMSSYALIQALTGVRYDAVEKTLYVDSRVGDFTSFLSTNTGFGNVIYKNGKVTVNVVYGRIDVEKIKISRS